MKKLSYTEEQIAVALIQAATTIHIGVVCRNMGISEATFYNWKKDLPVWGEGDELRCLRRLQDENQRLKKLVADLSLEKEMLQEVLKQNF